MKSNLRINIAGIKLKNPVMNASGTFGFGPGFARIEHPEKLGAIVTKTITMKPREGNPLPWIIKTETGLINSVGWANEGIEKFTEETLSKFLKFNSPVIANIGGFSIEDYSELTKMIDKNKGIAGIEIDASCPNVQKGKLVFSSDAGVTKKLVTSVRAETKLPIIVKLSSSSEIESIVRAAEEGGADAISLINALPGLAIDARKRKPILGGVTGGISGPAIKNHALLRVWQASKVTKLPIIGMGGISNANDAIEFIIAGATAVAIGTANYSNPKATEEIINGIEKYLLENGIDDISSLRGSLEN